MHGRGGRRERHKQCQHVSTCVSEDIVRNESHDIVTVKTLDMAEVKDLTILFAP